jgi:hypothetical protein
VAHYQQFGIRILLQACGEIAQILRGIGTDGIGVEIEKQA